MTQWMLVVFELWLTGGVNSNAVTPNVYSWRLGKFCQCGHLVRDGSRCDPCFHGVDDFSCVKVIPLVNRPAGLSSVGKYLQQLGSVILWICEIQWVTNAFLLFSNEGQSDYPSRGWWSNCEGCESLHDEVRWSEAVSSSLGSVNCLSSATLALVIIKDMSLSTHKKAMAPYAMGLVSATMCGFLGWCVVLLSLQRYRLGIVTLKTSWMACAMFNHSCWSSSDSGSSQSTLHWHSV